MANRTFDSTTNRQLIIPRGVLDPDQVNVVHIPRNLNASAPVLVVPPTHEGGPLRTQVLPDFQDNLSAESPRHYQATPRGCRSTYHGSRSTDKSVTFHNKSAPAAMAGATSDDRRQPPPSDNQIAGNQTFQEICSSSGTTSQPSLTHISSTSTTQINDGPIHSTSLSLDAPQEGVSPAAVDSILHQSQEYQPVWPEADSFTLSSLYDSDESVEMGAMGGIGLDDGRYNIRQPMTPSPPRICPRLPEHYGGEGFRPRFASSPPDSMTAMHMTVGSSEPSSLYEHEFYTPSRSGENLNSALGHTSDYSSGSSSPHQRQSPGKVNATHARSASPPPAVTSPCHCEPDTAANATFSAAKPAMNATFEAPTASGHPASNATFIAPQASGHLAMNATFTAPPASGHPAANATFTSGHPGLNATFTAPQATCHPAANATFTSGHPGLNATFTAPQASGHPAANATFIAPQASGHLASNATFVAPSSPHSASHHSSHHSYSPGTHSARSYPQHDQTYPQTAHARHRMDNQSLQDVCQLVSCHEPCSQDTSHATEHSYQSSSSAPENISGWHWRSADSPVEIESPPHLNQTHPQTAHARHRMDNQSLQDVCQLVSCHEPCSQETTHASEHSYQSSSPGPENISGWHWRSADSPVEIESPPHLNQTHPQTVHARHRMDNQSLQDVCHLVSCHEPCSHDSTQQEHGDQDQHQLHWPEADSFTLSSLYDSDESVEMGAMGGIGLDDGRYNIRQPMTPSPPRICPRLPEHYGGEGFRPRFASSPPDSMTAMHMTVGSSEPSSLYEHEFYTPSRSGENLNSALGDISDYSTSEHSLPQQHPSPGTANATYARSPPAATSCHCSPGAAANATFTQHAANATFIAPSAGAHHALNATYTAPPSSGHHALNATYTAPPSSGHPCLNATYTAPPSSGHHALNATYTAPPSSGHPCLNATYTAPPSSGHHDLNATYTAQPSSGHPALNATYSAPCSPGHSALNATFTAPSASAHPALNATYERPHSASSHGSSSGPEYTTSGWRWRSADNSAEPSPMGNQTYPQPVYPGHRLDNQSLRSPNTTLIQDVCHYANCREPCSHDATSESGHSYQSSSWGSPDGSSPHWRSEDNSAESPARVNQTYPQTAHAGHRLNNQSLRSPSTSLIEDVCHYANCRDPCSFGSADHSY